MGSRWVVDPIDGTVNFLYGLPAYAVSVAAKSTVSRWRGRWPMSPGPGVLGRGGTRRAGDRRRRAPTDHLQPRHRPVHGFAGHGFRHAPARRAAQAALLARMLPEVRDVRRMGRRRSICRMVAAGRLDVYYEHGLQVWDWAAGALSPQRRALWWCGPSRADPVAGRAAGGGRARGRRSAHRGAGQILRSAPHRGRAASPAGACSGTLQQALL